MSWYTLAQFLLITIIFIMAKFWCKNLSDNVMNSKKKVI